MSESAESVAHKSMIELADKIFKEHGIIIEAVKFNWFENETLDGEVEAFVRSIHLATKVIG